MIAPILEDVRVNECVLYLEASLLSSSATKERDCKCLCKKYDGFIDISDGHMRWKTKQDSDPNVLASQGREELLIGELVEVLVSVLWGSVMHIGSLANIRRRSRRGSAVAEVSVRPVSVGSDKMANVQNPSLVTDSVGSEQAEKVRRVPRLLLLEALIKVCSGGRLVVNKRFRQD